MKCSQLFLTAMLLVATLGALLLGTRSAAAAVKVPDDLTGNWLGSFEPNSDPRSVGEAAMRVDSQERNHFKGKLALGRHVFDIAGAVTVDPPQPDKGEATPPEPDNRLLIVGATPPEPDMPGAMIFIRGNVRFIDPPQPDADPPGSIVADYMIVLADGSLEFGSVRLAKVGSLGR